MPEYQLTIPPSTNNLFVNVGRRRIKSKQYSAWLTENALRLRLQRIVTVSAPARIELKIKGGRGFSRQRDGDNCLKSVYDLLVSVGILESDRFTALPDQRLLYVEDLRKEAVAECTVTVESISDLRDQDKGGV